jgi:hypothetical protein
MIFDTLFLLTPTTDCAPRPGWEAKQHTHEFPQGLRSSEGIDYPKYFTLP